MSTLLLQVQCIVEVSVHTSMWINTCLDAGKTHYWTYCLTNRIISFAEWTRHAESLRQHDHWMNVNISSILSCDVEHSLATPFNWVIVDWPADTPLHYVEAPGEPFRSRPGSLRPLATEGCIVVLFVLNLPSLAVQLFRISKKSGSRPERLLAFSLTITVTRNIFASFDKCFRRRIYIHALPRPYVLQLSLWL